MKGKPISQTGPKVESMKGASAIVSAVLVILIGVVGVSIVILVGLPALERAGESNVVGEAQRNMLIIDDVIRQTASEGAGIVKEANLEISGGSYRANPEAGTVEYDLVLESDVLPRGMFTRDGNLVTSVSGPASATQNSTHLIIGNDVLEVVFPRVGSESSFASINTSSVISTIRFKDDAAAIVPIDTSVKIGNLTSTSWGTGYTKLAREGSALPKADVLAHIQSSQGAEYEVLYSLRGSADFLTVDVLNTSMNKTTMSYAYRIGSNSSDRLRFGDNLAAVQFSIGSSQIISQESTMRVILDNTNYTRNSSSVVLSIGNATYVLYNASDGSLRDVRELQSIGQGIWNFTGNSTHTVVNYTLAGSDGYEYGIRDSRPGGSYWLDENSSLYGMVNISNDFIRVGMTERNLTVYNSSGKAIFNASFDDAVKVDGQNLISLYGSGTQNKTVYFYDWSNQTWKVWVKNASNSTHGVPDWLDPRNKQEFKWRYRFVDDATRTRPAINLTFLVTAHDQFVRTFVDVQPATISATGGTITYSNDYKIHTFTSNGTFTPMGSFNVNYLVVGGGGGGGGVFGSANDPSGGGGAGGFRTSMSNSFPVNIQSYNVTVGSGGAGGPATGAQGSNGGDSIFSTIVATGGGGGAGYFQVNNSACTGKDGGSGGGGACYASFAGGAGNTPSTSPAQGRNGGTGRSSATETYDAAGGGGAGREGASGSTNAGIGGSGNWSVISGSNVTYAGGGGGASPRHNNAGGSGGGGTGGSGAGTAAGTAGTANTGGGGGGSDSVGGSIAGASGGSGVVIISYLNINNVTHNVTFPFSLPEVRTNVTTASGPGIYFTSNTSSDEVLFTATNFRNATHNFNVSTNRTANLFSFNYTFNSTQNQNFLFALGTMGRMNTTKFSPQSNATQFSNETVESVANSTLTWYDLLKGTDFEDDFSRYATQAAADSAWVPTADYMNVSIANDNLQFFAQNGADRKIYYDLGSGVSNESWVLRFKMRFSNINAGSPNIFFLGLSSTTGAANTAQNFIEIGPYSADGQPHNILAGAGVRQDQATYESRHSDTYVANRDYYVEIRRINPTTVDATWYSDNGYKSVALKRINLTNSGMSSITSLRYLKLNTYVTLSGSHSGIIDDVQFWNGVNYATGPSTNVTFRGTNASQHNFNLGFNYDGGATAIWRFDEGSGLNATDSSGNIRTLSLINGPSWLTNSSCKYDGCIALDGTDDYMEVCSTCMNFMSQSGVFAVSFWMRPTAVSGGNFNVFDQADRANANGVSIALTSSNSDFYFGIRGGGGGSWINYVGIHTSNLKADQWQHVAFVGDGTKTKAYLNGNFMGVSASDFSAVTPSYSSKIGRAHSAGEFYKGYLDEFRIYNKALSDTEVREQYQRQVTKYYDDFGTAANKKTYRYFGVEDSNISLQPITPVDASIHYRFNDNSSIAAADSSGNNRNSDVSGAVWATNSSCRTVFGGCMAFDANNDYLRYNSGMSFSGDMTVSMWIYPNNSGSTQMLTGDYLSGGGTEWQFSYSGAVNSLQFWRGSSIAVGGNYVIQNNTWNHVVLTRVGTGSNNIHIYANGNETATGTLAGSFGGGAGSELMIGLDGDLLQEDFGGYIDEYILLQNRGLSAGEVYQLYLGGANRTVGGKWHRVAQSDGVQSMSFNLTDHNNTLDGQDYDMRALSINGTVTSVLSIPTAPTPGCFDIANVTRPYACSYDDSEFPQGKTSGIIAAGRAQDFSSICFENMGDGQAGSIYRFNLTAIGPLKTVIPFSTGSCATIGNGSSTVFSQGIPALPFGSYLSGGPANLQMVLQYDRIKVLGDLSMGAGSERACFKKIGQDGSRILINATSC